MERKIVRFVSMVVMAGALLTGCAFSDSQKEAEDQKTAEIQEEDMGETPEQSGISDQTSDSVTESGVEERADAPAVTLEDGVYTADFDTDSSMFHVSEACDGKGTLTVENGNMVIHVSLASKNIVGLFPGLAEDAGKDGAELLEPTVDSVTYSDGITEEVYGFDIPVPVLEEEFDLALIGKKGTWYDHKVSVSNPEKTE